tara:strand:- start:54 stop:314 length:261 start_codon:yes stop_codon:yes gene_type:complete
MESNKIISESRKIYNKTEDLKKNKIKIKNDINLEFKNLIKNEKRILKKCLLIIIKEIKIYKQIKELTSLKKLYVKNNNRLDLLVII